MSLKRMNENINAGVLGTQGVTVRASGAKPNSIEKTLSERGSTYGSFEEQGQIEQAIKRVFHDTPNWKSLNDDSKSALEMIATKISRILKGNPEHHDSWHDIVGYAKLVADRIERNAKPISKEMGKNHPHWA